MVVSCVPVCEKVTAVFAACAVLLYVDVTGGYQHIVGSKYIVACSCSYTLYMIQ